jgi:integrase
MKVTVRAGKNNNKKVWVVDHTPPGGKRKRKVFQRKTDAETEAEAIRSEATQSGLIWLGLSASERRELVSVYGEIKGEGHTLRSVWEAFKSAGKRPAPAGKTLGSAAAAFMEEKRLAQLSAKSLAWYKSGLGNFVAGREAAPLGSITRDMVLEWLRNPQWGPRTFNARRSCMQIFFEWCKALKFIGEIPTESIPRIAEKRMPDLDVPPVILCLEQAAALLSATLRLDRGLIPYVAAGLFAGLRPEKEAGRLCKAHIQDGLLYVPGANAKDRQRRHIEIHPTLKAWLALEGGDYAQAREDGKPGTICNLRKRFEAVREAAGLIRRVKVEGKERLQIEFTGWDQDCLRHSFASHFLPVFGADKTIEAMGHGDYDMLFRHYRALVTPREAKAYWEITPALIRLPKNKFAAWLEANSARKQ